MLSIEELLMNGYKEFEKPVYRPYVYKFFQKKVTDDIGIRYFINCYIIKENEELIFEFETELCGKRDLFTHSYRIYSIDKKVKLADIERNFSKAWFKLDTQYYQINKKEF